MTTTGGPTASAPPPEGAQRRDSGAYLRLALEAGRMAVWEHDAARDALTSSPWLNRLLGYADDAQLDLEEIRTRYFPGDRERLIEAATAALKRGESFFEGEFRFNRQDGELRWFLMRAEISLGRDGAPSRTFGVLLDITSRKVAEDALRDRDLELSAALEAGNLAIFDHDHVTQRMKPSERISELYGYPPGDELTIDRIRARYHPNDAEGIRRRAMQDAADPSVRFFEWSLPLLLPDQQVRWLEGRGEYLRDGDGKIVRSRGVLLDVSERKRWEEHQRLLVNELNHRVKNTLAIVQSIAAQSFRHVQDMPARDAFEARLAALAAAHDLLTGRNWEAADLEDLLRALFTGTAGDVAGRLTAQGPSVLLHPQTAVSFVLAFHELCTNALKYGALSSEQGEVHVGWRIDASENGPRLHLTWREQGGPLVHAPRQRGFGSRMIERALASELGGRAELLFLPTGVVCEIDAPLPEPRGSPLDQLNP